MTAIAALCLTAPAHAATYAFSFDITGGTYESVSPGALFGSGGQLPDYLLPETISGEIETDGTLGILTNANILSWSFDLSGANSSHDIGVPNDFATHRVFGFENVLATAGSLSLLGANFGLEQAGANLQLTLQAEAFGTISKGFFEQLPDGSLFGETYDSNLFTPTDFATRVDTVSAVPVPATLPLALLGLVGLGAVRRRV